MKDLRVKLAISDGGYVLQAMEFLQQVKDSPDGWQVCLPLFVRDPRPNEIVRMFCLDVLNTAIQLRYQSPQDQSLTYIKNALVDYMRQVYFPNSNMSDSNVMQNKLTQTMTYLFVAMYTVSWPSFFDDILALTSASSDSSGQPQYNNYQGVMFFLRMTAGVHDEVADVLVPRSTEEMQRNSLIKDALRERDVRKLVTSWQEILAQWRGANEDIVLLSLKNIGRWVSWIDISLVVNEVMLNLLYYFLASEGRPRNAAIETLAEIVGKKMKGPDKLDLISFLKLGEIVGTLVASPALTQGQEIYDFDLAEGVAKLVNGIGVDLIRILDADNVDLQSKQHAEEYLQSFIPFLLRFFSDEFDEVSQAVFIFMFDLLTLLRKEKKVSGTVSQSHAQMLPPILNAIVVKMKYDVDTTWGDEDEQTDEAEFQELRKKLKTLQDAVASIDEGLYIQSLSTLVGNTFERVAQGGNGEVDWREVETALYEMFLFGELMMRAGGLFVKGQPNGVAAETLIAMMFKMMDSSMAFFFPNFPLLLLPYISIRCDANKDPFCPDISSFSHPAVKLRYMEILNRYSAFFESNTNLIPQALEDFVKGVHDSHVRVRRRSWYLFQRFVKSLKTHIGDIAETVLQAIGDLLVIKAEAPKDIGDDEMSSDENQAEDSAFESQLCLFDAVGCLSSIRSIPEERQVMFAQTIMNPLFRDMEKNLGTAKTGNVQAVLQIHHNIMALGTLARGFSDWQPNTTSTTPPSELVSEEFKNAADAILVSLESLNRFPNIREAARHSFSRMVGVLGPKILSMLPRWIDGLLAANSSKEEMVTFLKLLEQVVHGFKVCFPFQIYD